MGLENRMEQLEFAFMKDLESADQEEKIFLYARQFNIGLLAGAVTGAIIQGAHYCGAVNYLSLLLEKYFL